MASVLSGAKVTLLSGPEGWGKSTLLRTIVQDMERFGYAVTLAKAAQLPPSLELCGQPGRDRFVFVDDATHLSEIECAALAAMPYARFILAGTAEIEQRFAMTAPLPPIVRLAAMTDVDAREFATVLLARSRFVSDQVSANAIELTIAAARGNTRLLAALTSGAIEAAMRLGETTLATRHVGEAITLLGLAVPDITLRADQIDKPGNEDIVAEDDGDVLELHARAAPEFDLDTIRAQLSEPVARQTPKRALAVGLGGIVVIMLGASLWLGLKLLPHGAVTPSLAPDPVTVTTVSRIDPSTEGR